MAFPQNNRQLLRSAAPWLLGWLILNLLQALFTELFHDEAYYWYLSSRLQWGYSEHAPGMMALIALSRWIPGELGVRLFPVLMSTLGLALLTLLARPRHVSDWFWLLLSMSGLHAIGFFAAPDSPLFVTVLLFWTCYRLYLKEDSLANSAMLAGAIALMLYSKYHGAMTLFFVVLSYPALLNKRSFWLVVGLSTALFLPQLWWLWQDDFGTFRFHLGERTPGPWYPGRTLEFWGALLLLAGPLVALPLFWGAARHKARDLWERGLRWTLWGMLALLSAMTLHNRVEANWAATALIPLLLLGFWHFEQRGTWQKWLKPLAIATLLPLLVLRVYLAWDFLPGENRFRNEYHRWPEWAGQIDSLSEGAPVVFVNWYSYPSKFAFYTGKPALGTSNLWYHRTQISEWTKEVPLQGKPALIVSTFFFPGMDSLTTAVGKTFYYQALPRYRSFEPVKLASTDTPWDLLDGQEKVTVSMVQNTDSVIRIREQDAVRIIGHVFDGPRQLYTIIHDPLLELDLHPGEAVTFSVDLGPMANVAAGSYRAIWSLQVGSMILNKHGDWQEVEVVK